jgi:predicted transposase YbfD/YdcC
MSAPTGSRPLMTYLAEIPDPRVELKCLHDLIDVIMIVTCGTIVGADDFVSIAEFARAKEHWFRGRLGLELRNGIPSHDTLNRVFAIVRPEEFNRCFLAWVTDASEALKLPHIPIDGKTMRGSKRRTRTGTRKTTHIVSAWSHQLGLTLGQVQTDEKSNEITAIPELLELLDISGALVSIDAMGCPKDIAEQIVGAKGDYLLAVKENQPRLFEDLQRLADAALETNYAGLSTHLKEETGHGRQEMRFGFVIEDLKSVRDRDAWPGLRSMVGIVSSRTVGSKTSDEVRYYISSRKTSAAQFQSWVRSHWSIENSCHWVLDVAFREDDHRLREGHGPQNMSLVRKIALAKLKNADAKCGIKNRRLKAGWDNTYLEQVLLKNPED